jgi:hypothetical protein
VAIAVALAYLAAAAIGGGAALGELVSRYKDAPFDAATSTAGLIYIAFNAGVSFLAIYLIRVVFPMQGDPTPLEVATLVTDVLIARVGAMAALRSSVVTVKSGGADVPIGFAAIVEIFRTALDRDVDRVRAAPRARLVGDAMQDVSFVRCFEALTSVCVSLLQNMPADEAAALRQRVGALANQTGRTDRDKALELGLILAGSVGFPVLEEAKKILLKDITAGRSRSETVAALIARLQPEQALIDLPTVSLALNPSVPTESQAALRDQIEAIRMADVSLRAKTITVGLLLANVVGEDALSAAVTLIARDGRPGAGGPPDEPAPV